MYKSVRVYIHDTRVFVCKLHGIYLINYKVSLIAIKLFLLKSYNYRIFKTFYFQYVYMH